MFPDIPWFVYAMLLAPVGLIVVAAIYKYLEVRAASDWLKRRIGAMPWRTAHHAARASKGRARAKGPSVLRSTAQRME